MAGRTAWAGIVAALLVAAPAPAADVSGRAEATDGDTLAIGTVRIRLHGIDAPETGQHCARADGGDWDCGAAARNRLAALIAGQVVRCAPRERDGYGRLIATCAVGDADLGARLVGEGLAWAYAHFSSDYVGVEAEARARQAGLWQGAAQPAWDYRAEAFAPAAAEVAAEAPDGCTIKGNITAAGERVYHTPASPWYARTKVDEAAGEHWFCDAAEAEAAGWRAAGGSR